MPDTNAYILGTDNQELLRLDIQHKVWQSETKKGWSLAGFKEGQTLLDLGSGPGSCSLELADIVGPSGNIVAIDRSQSFINHLSELANNFNLPIETIHSDFDSMKLVDNSLDGMFCRWALAWVSNPKEIIGKITKAVKPGGILVFHEYFDWSTHHIYPETKNLMSAITAALNSFKESDSEIDVGAFIPGYLDSFGASIVSTRLMPKLASPNSDIWKWPKTFYESYFPRLIDMGYLKKQTVESAFAELKDLESLHYARLACPLMIEVIAEVN